MTVHELMKVLAVDGLDKLGLDGKAIVVRGKSGYVILPVDGVGEVYVVKIEEV